MKTSYKLSLLAAAALFALVLVYYGTQGGAPEGGSLAGDAPAADPSPPPADNAPSQRPTLRDDGAETPGLTPGPAPAATPPAERSVPDLGERGIASVNRYRALVESARPGNRPQPEAPAGPSAERSAERSAPAPSATADTPTAESNAPAASTGPAGTAEPAAVQTAADPTPEADRPAAAPPADVAGRARPAQAQPPAPPSTYTVEPGDTLSSIAIKLYGSDRHWVDIAQANPLVDPIRLRVGQELRLPDPEALRGAGATDAAAPGDVITYTVRSGDTLSGIAKQYYGSAAEWRVIYNTNRQKIGPNPSAIQAGMTLTIPPLPRRAQ